MSYQFHVAHNFPSFDLALTWLQLRRLGTAQLHAAQEHLPHGGGADTLGLERASGWENPRKTHRKTIGKWWFHGILWEIPLEIQQFATENDH